MGRIRERSFTAAMVILSSVLTPVIFASFTIYSGNTLEFGVSIGRMLTPMILFCITVWIAGVILLIIAPKPALKYLVSFFLALSLLFWIQANLLVWDYGVLDGRPIGTREYATQAVVDSSAWILVFMVFIFFAGRVHAHAWKIAVALIAMQFLTLGMALWKMDEPPGFHRYRLDETYKYSFSNEKNVVVIILDAFQADVMMEILHDHPGYHADFDGFTYYPNSLSAYAKTSAALPAMLTGRWYENRQPLQRFLARAFTTGSITSELVSLGWRVDLFPAIERTVHFSERVASNMVPRTERRGVAEEAGRLMDVALFRSSPHVLKTFWLNDYRWRFSRWFATMDPGTETVRRKFEGIDHPHPAVGFIKEADAFSTYDLSAPSFKLYHFMIPHEPFMLNENLELERLPSGRGGFVRHSMAGLEIVKRFLDVFRQAGIYDKTMFLVLSDHGGGEYRADIQQALLPETILAGGQDETPIPPKHMQSGLPLVLIKPFGASGKLAISHAPVSLGDIASTIAGALALKKDYGGRNILQLDEWEDRTRRYLHFEFDGWEKPFLPAMTEYFVDGHSWLPGSWTASGRIFRPPLPGKGAGDDDPNGLLYELGREIHFTQDSQEQFWLEEGWSYPESWGTWSEGESAVIRVPLTDRASGALEARLLFRPFLAGGELAQQRVLIVVNGHDLGEWRAAEWGWHGIFIPFPIASMSESLEIMLVMPEAASPVEFHIRDDDRKLGIGISRMVIFEPSFYEPGQMIRFSDKSRHQSWLVDGWHEPGEHTVWSRGHTSVLRVPLAETARGPLEARFSFAPYLAEGALDSQVVRVSVNGTFLTEWVAVEKGWYGVVIPPDLIQGTAILEFVFQLPHATSPTDHLPSIDTRVFGIELSEMEIITPTHEEMEDS